jgi:hypothetical protein
MSKVFVTVVLILALLMSILGSVLPLEKMHDFMLVMRFFENMIPILAVGALLRYVTCGGSSCNCGGNGCSK